MMFSGGSPAGAAMDFEWDDAKAEANERKHGVSFAEAMTVLADPLSLTGYDPDHSVDEDRFITMGLSAAGRMLLVSHTDRGEKVRIISARKASRGERRDYEDGDFP
jgi:uncharacterized DUF497 family protein